MAEGIKVYCRVRPQNKSEHGTEGSVNVVSANQIKVIQLDKEWTSSNSNAPSGGLGEVAQKFVGGGSKSMNTRISLGPEFSGGGGLSFGPGARRSDQRRDDATPTKGTSNASLMSAGGGSTSTPLENPGLFTFDRVFGNEATQVDVYKHVGTPMIKEVMEGFNCTIFAYGQTGSGKTHTMMGVSTEPDTSSVSSSPSSTSQHGIIPRLIHDIFDTIESADEDIDFTIKVSMLEVYLERIRDLLNPINDNLKVRESANGVWVDDLTECYVASVDEVLEFIAAGNAARSVGETNMNEKSSRSHSVVILTIGQNNTKTGEKRGSKLTLVDLAGSEKIVKTGAEGERLKEAQHINKSLSALGNVINALSTNQPHVPYRDSKLTRLLTDSIGGNSKTALIVTCSPSVIHTAETISTLRFGKRAKFIKNKPVRNRERSIEEYKQMLVNALAGIQRRDRLIKRMAAELLKLKTTDTELLSDAHDVSLADTFVATLRAEIENQSEGKSSNHGDEIMDASEIQLRETLMNHSLSRLQSREIEGRGPNGVLYEGTSHLVNTPMIHRALLAGPKTPIDVSVVPSHLMDATPMKNESREGLGVGGDDMLYDPNGIADVIRFTDVEETDGNANGGEEKKDTDNQASPWDADDDDFSGEGSIKDDSFTSKTSSLKDGVGDEMDEVGVVVSPKPRPSLVRRIKAEDEELEASLAAARVPEWDGLDEWFRRAMKSNDIVRSMKEANETLREDVDHMTAKIQELENDVKNWKKAAEESTEALTRTQETYKGLKRREAEAQEELSNLREQNNRTMTELKAQKLGMEKAEKKAIEDKEDMAKEISRKTKKVEELTKRIDELDQMRRTVEETRDELVKRLSEVEEQARAMQTTITAREDVLKEEQEARRNREKEIAELKRHEENMKEEVDRLTSRLNTLTKDNEELVVTLDKTRASLQAKEKDVLLLTEDKESLTRSLETKKKELAATKDEIETLTTNHRTSEGKLSSEVARLTEEQEVLKTKVQSMEQDKQQLDQSLLSAKRVGDELKAEVKRLETSLYAQREEISQLNMSLETKSGEIGALTKESERLRQKYEGEAQKYMESIKGMEERLKAHATERGQMTKECNDLKHQVSAQRDQITGLEDHIKELEHKTQQVNEEKSHLQRSLDEHKAQLDSNKQEILSLTSQVETLTQRIVDHEQDRSTTDKVHRDREKAREEAHKAEVDQLEEKLACRQSELESRLATAHKEYESKVQSLTKAHEAKIASQGRDLNMKVDDIAKLSREVTEQREANVAALESNKRLQATIRELEATMESLRQELQQATERSQQLERRVNDLTSVVNTGMEKSEQERVLAEKERERIEQEKKEEKKRREDMTAEYASKTEILRRELSEAEQKVGKQEALVAELKQSLADKQRQVEEWENKCTANEEEWEREKDELHEAINELETSLTSLETANATLRVEKESLMKEASKLEGEISQSSARLSELNKNITVLMTQATKSEEIISGLRLDCARVNEEKTKALKHVDDITGQIRELERVQAELKAKESVLTSRVDGLKASLREAMDEKHQTQSQLEDLKAQVAQLEESHSRDHTAAIEELAAKDKQISSLRHDLSDSERKLVELQSSLDKVTGDCTKLSQELLQERDTADREKKQSLDQISQLTKDKTMLTTKLAKVEKEFKDARETYEDRLTEQTSKMNGVSKRLIEALGQLKEAEEKEEMGRIELMKIKREVREKEIALDNTERKVQEITKALMNSQTTVHEYAKTIQKEKNEKEEKERSYIDIKLQLEVLGRERDREKNEFASVVANLKAKQEKEKGLHEADRKHWTELVERERQFRLDKIEELAAASEKSLREAKKGHEANLEEVKMAYEDKLEALQAELARAVREKQEMEEVAADNASAKAVLEFDYRKVKDALDAMRLQWEMQIQQQLEHVQTENAERLRLAQQNSKGKASKLEEELRNLRAQLDDKDRQLEKKCAQYIEMVMRKDGLEDTCKDLEKKIKELETQLNSALKADFKRVLAEENKSLRQKLNEVQQINSKLVMADYYHRKQMSGDGDDGAIRSFKSSAVLYTPSSATANNASGTPAAAVPSATPGSPSQTSLSSLVASDAISDVKQIVSTDEQSESTPNHVDVDFVDIPVHGRSRSRSILNPNFVGDAVALATSTTKPRGEDSGQSKKRMITADKASGINRFF